jgi:hypothetical protein
MFGCFWGSIPYALVITSLGAMLDSLNSINEFVSSTPLYVVFLVFTVGAVFLVAGSWMLYNYANEAIDVAIREAATSSLPVAADAESGTLEKGEEMFKDEDETDRLLPR